MGTLLSPLAPANTVAAFLDEHHYLGAARRGLAWDDEYGVLVLSNPTSRHLPSDWLELVRWCLVGTPNGGSQQWARVSKWLRANHPATTVVSYSDPHVGHTGALYKASNWLPAPTPHRLRPPPSGNGTRNGVRQEVKDRWVFPLRPDARRATVLAVKDGALNPDNALWGQ